MWSNCSLFSALHRNVIRKIEVLGNIELSKSRKNDIFGKSLKKFPGITAGNFREHRFPGIPGNFRTGIPGALELALPRGSKPPFIIGLHDSLGQFEPTTQTPSRVLCINMSYDRYDVWIFKTGIPDALRSSPFYQTSQNAALQWARNPSKASLTLSAERLKT